MTYTYAARVHDKARASSLRTLVDRHRGVFDTLRTGWAAEVRREEPELDSKRVHDKARTRAVSDLVDMYREEYEALRQKAVADLRRIPGPVS